MRLLSLLIGVLFILLVAVALYMGFTQLNIARWKLDEAAFRMQSQLYVNVVKEHLRGDIEILRATRGLFESSVLVEPVEWNAFMESLDIEHHPGFLWLAYAPYLSKGEAKERPTWPQHTGETLCPILHYYPKIYETIEGFDFCSEAIYRQIFQESMGTQDLTFAPALRLNKIRQSKHQRLLILPVEKEGKTVGWVLGQLDFSQSLQHILDALEQQHLGVAIYVENGESGQTLLLEQIINETPRFTDVQSFSFESLEFRLVFQMGNPSQLHQPLASPVFFLWIILILALTYVVLLLIRYLGFKGASRQQCYRLTQIFESMPYALIVADKEGVISDFNPAAEKLLGYQASEVVGKMTPEIFHIKEEMIARANDLSTILKREVPSDFGVFVALAEIGYIENRRWTYKKKDGRTVEVQLSVTALHDTPHHIFGYYGIAIEHDQIKFW